MISKCIEELILKREIPLITPAENVATLQITNPLTHAVLVLTQVQYAKIPVLDKEDKYWGLVGLTDIMLLVESLGFEELNFEKLSRYTVADVVDQRLPTITKDASIELMLNWLSDASFLPVVDEDGTFQGILTRSRMLNALNHTAHILDEYYDVTERE